MSEQSTLKTGTKKPIVKAIVDLHSARVCIVFPETGQMACLMFSKWEHIPGVSLKRKVKQPHHKVEVLIPDDSVIMANNKGDLHRILQELTDKYELKPSDDNLDLEEESK